jgi:hypothetical protein
MHFVIILNGQEIVVVLLMDIIFIENVTINSISRLFNAVDTLDYVKLVLLK